MLTPSGTWRGAPAEPPRAIGRRDLLALRFESPRREAGHWIRVHRPAMACRFEVVLDAEDARHVAAARAALDEVERIEDALTVFRDTSELVDVNRRAGREPVAVSAGLFRLLELSRALHAATDGAFDITTTPLSRCWGFLKRQGRVPCPADVEAARAVVGMDKVELDPARREVRFRRPGVELNLGSIGKGYALDRMAERLRESGVERALLSAGASSVLAIGGGGAGWRVDLRSRQVKRDRIARLRLRGAALGTSGAGEQYVDVGGRRYGHVLDPRTGWPASGALSASVVAADAARADALSTALLVGGVDLARRLCASHPDVLALVVDAEERTHVFGTHPAATLAEEQP